MELSGVLTEKDLERLAQSNQLKAGTAIESLGEKWALHKKLSPQKRREQRIPQSLKRG